VVNLLGNAIKYTPTSFEPGVGLDLPISGELIRRMGGDINVTSAEGSGSTFTAWLPLV
jgi:signal transduction histidine kinase